MACEAPHRAYRAYDGSIRFFKRTDRQYHVEPYTGLNMPCGKCILCRKEQARQQTVRIVHEAQTHFQNCMVTLTYNDEHAPSDGALNHKHALAFIRALRKRGYKLRYYGVGEYGDKTQRPHYHVCIFGQDFIDGRVITQTAPYMVWISPLLEEIWGRGQVKVVALNNATAAYVAGYVQKKIGKHNYVKLDQPTGELIAVEQPRPFMSRNLARQWWEKWHHHSEDRDRVVMDGRVEKPPAAYDRWLAQENKPKLIDIKLQRELRAERRKYEDRTKMRARARNAHARAREQARSKTF